MLLKWDLFPTPRLRDCYELPSITLFLCIFLLSLTHKARRKVQCLCVCLCVCFLPGIAWWRCQTQRQRCSRCRWGLWWTWGPWPLVRSWWDETHGETDGTPSKAQWSCNTQNKTDDNTSPCINPMTNVTDRMLPCCITSVHERWGDSFDSNFGLLVTGACI